ncbi:hypothetical protein LUR55_09375 [Luteimonas sp. C4P040a]|nr:hypothetical protein [Luteimonas fraxinea]
MKSMINNRILLVFAALGILLSGCGKDIDSAAENEQCKPYEKAGVPCHVPIAAVFAEPQSFLSTDIQVFGFLASGSTPASLFMSRESWAMGDQASSMRLESAVPDVLTSFQDANVSYVAVSGRLTAGRRPEARQPYLTLTVTDVVNLFEADDLSKHEQTLRAELER